MRPIFLIASAALAVTGLISACTSSAPATQVAAKPAAAGVCIEPSRIREHKVISDDEVQFTLYGDQVWTNHLARSCPGLKAQGSFAWDASTSICSNRQTIIVLERGTPCQLGDFTRVAAKT